MIDFRRFLFLMIVFSLVLSACAPAVPAPLPPVAQPTETLPASTPSPTPLSVKAAFETGVYRNLFAEYLGKSDAETRAKIDQAWNQLFYGDDASERVYYPVGSDLAYVLDTGNDDVRSEGMSYGMMVAVQLNKKEEFDRIWKWAKTYMYQTGGGYKGYFAWHCKPDGTQLAANPASDGEEWFIMALFFADARWGSGQGIYNYRAEAQSILDTALHVDQLGGDLATNLFDPQTKQVVFVPQMGKNSSFTDPSYHLPHFYELWARWAGRDNQFWADAAAASRAYLKTTVHPQTGLAPNYSYFDGKPYNDEYNGAFRYDSFRVGANLGVDYAWFAADPWEVEQSNRLLDFFASQGMNEYTAEYSLDGKPLSSGHPAGLVGTNAAAALAADPEKGKPFVQALWDLSIPTGKYRYYDGLLALLGLLQVSGNFRIYTPGSAPQSGSIATPVPQVAGKFAPPGGRALLLVGPDAKNISAYFDALVTAPGGVSIDLTLKKLDMKALDEVAKKFPNSALSVGLNLGGLADSISAGKADPEIDRLLAALTALQRPVYLRFGAEFDHPANKTGPESYVLAWKYFHARMQAQGVKDIALVWQSAAACDQTLGGQSVADWYPGDEFVDWVAFSYLNQPATCEGKSIAPVIQFAREHYKPVMMLANPPNLGSDAWEKWYAPMVEFIHANNDLIRAVTYLNTNSRLLSNPEILKRWKAETSQSFWLRGGPSLFSTLEQ